MRIALQAGYTHIDCAHIYGNEIEIGQGIKDWGGDRTTIWVTSKVSLKPKDITDVFSCGIISIDLAMFPGHSKRL